MHFQKTTLVALLGLTLAGCNTTIPAAETNALASNMQFTENGRPMWSKDITCHSSGTQQSNMHIFSVNGNNPNIEADWGYNNDWGWWVFNKNVPDVDSCMYRDGTGWYFDLDKKIVNGRPHAWHSPTLIKGSRPWGIGENKYNPNEFPIRIRDIEELDLDLKYTYVFYGEGNTNVTFHIGDGNLTKKEIVKQDPEMEVMLWLKHNHLIRERKNPAFYRGPGRTSLNVTVDDAKWIGFTRTAKVMGDKFGFDVTELVREGADTNQSGTYEFTVDIKAMADYLVSKGLVDSDDYIYDVTFLNEIWYGVGKMDIDKFDITLETK